MTLLYDELRDAIAGRNAEPRLDASGRTCLAVSVHFSRPLSRGALDAIAGEAPHAQGLRIPGVVGPIDLEIAPTLITLILDAVDPALLRLDTLLSALVWSGSPLGSPLSAAVLVELCKVVQALHGTIAPDGFPRVHREIHAGTVLIDPGGQLRLFGDGLPALSAVLLPRLQGRGDRHRLLAPEAARGEPLDPRADVYSLGVLYYELLSGHRYREGQNPTSIAQAAIEGRPPELPGALPDPRRELVQVLGRALAPDPNHRFHNARTLAEAIGAEAASARIAIPGGAVLERMIDEFVPVGVERGRAALLNSEHEPAAFDAIMCGLAETIGSPPAHDSGPASGDGWQGFARAGPDRQAKRTASPASGDGPAVRIPVETPTAPTAPATSDAWSHVLGDHVDDGAAVTPPAKPAALTLPAPAPASSGPTQPLSSEHLAALATRPARPATSDLSRRTSAPSLGPEAPQHTAVRVALSLAGLALVVAVGFGLKARSSASSVPPPPEVVALPDAAVVVAAPDTGVVETKPIGLLTVLSRPSGATVEIDGGYVGRTPLVMHHEFQNRGYAIRVLADGFAPWEKTAFPDTKSSISVIAELTKE